MARKLERWYGLGHLHFITTSCYRRMPLLKTSNTRDTFLKFLNEVRDEFDFALLEYVVMPEHVHLLVSEPNIGDPSDAMKALKERTAHSLCPPNPEWIYKERSSKRSRPMFVRIRIL
jgi:putative transposase